MGRESAVLRAFLIAGALTAVGLAFPLAAGSPQATRLPHGPISIYGDDQFTPDHGVVSGNGTAANPFVIEGWDIEAGSGIGVSVQDTGAMFVIRDCHIRSTNFGIDFWNVARGRIENNSINASGTGVELDESNHLLIRNNNFTGTGLGLATYNSRNVTLFANSFAAGGIFVEGASLDRYDSLIVPANNTIRGRPIMFVKDSAGTIVDGADVGQILMVNVASPIIKNVTTHGAYVNVFLAFVSHALVTRNVIANGVYGMFLDKSLDVQITENNISSNADTGISVDYSSTATIVGNQIRSNRYGVRVELGSSGTIFHNNFVLNSVSAVVDVDFVGNWDDAYPSGGNYWSDYSGFDSCSGEDQNVCPAPDGIGDTPRTLGDFPRVKDRFPLMFPFDEASPTQPDAYRLYGSQLSGWGSSPGYLTSPGPVFGIAEGATVTLQLYSLDGLVHGWFLDVNNNSLADPGEPLSPDFESVTIPLNFTFTAPTGVVGVFEYRCRYHPDVMRGAFVIRPARAKPYFSLNANLDGWDGTNPGPTLELYYGETAELFLSTVDYTHWFNWFIDYSNDTFEQPWEPASGAFWYNSPVATQFTANRLGTFTYRSSYYPTLLTGLVRLIGPQTSGSVPPTTQATLSGSRGLNGWFVSAVTVSLSSMDLLASITGTYVRVDTEAWSNYSGPFAISADGAHLVSFYSTDSTGNVEAVQSVSIRIDKVAPLVRIVEPTQISVSSPLSVRWQGDDATSEVSHYLIQIDGGELDNVGKMSSATFDLADGVHIFSITAFDEAGNSASDTRQFVVTNRTAAEPPSHATGSNFDSLGLGVAVAVVGGTAAGIVVWWARTRRNIRHGLRERSRGLR